MATVHGNIAEISNIEKIISFWIEYLVCTCAFRFLIKCSQIKHKIVSTEYDESTAAISSEQGLIFPAARKML